MTRRAPHIRTEPASAPPPMTGGGAPPSHPALIEIAKALARLAVEEDIAAASSVPGGLKVR